MDRGGQDDLQSNFLDYELSLFLQFCKRTNPSESFSKILGCGLVERHLEMAQPTSKKFWQNDNFIKIEHLPMNLNSYKFKN